MARITFAALAALALIVPSAFALNCYVSQIPVVVGSQSGLNTRYGFDGSTTVVSQTCSQYAGLCYSASITKKTKTYGGCIAGICVDGVTETYNGNYAACGTAIDNCSALQSGYPTSQSFNSTSLGLFMSTAGQIATNNIEQSVSSVQCCSTDNCNSNAAASYSVSSAASSISANLFAMIFASVAGLLLSKML